MLLVLVLGYLWLRSSRYPASLGAAWQRALHVTAGIILPLIVYD